MKTQRKATPQQRRFKLAIGKIIQSIREEQDIKQEDLAAAVGISQPPQSYREAGINGIPTDDLLPYSQALGVSMATIITRAARLARV